MAKYQHTSGEIVDAVQFKPLPHGKAWPKGVISWEGHVGGQPRDMSWGFVDTPGERRHVMADDWILTDSIGNHFVRSPEAFEALYKPLVPVRTTTDRGFTIYDQFTDMRGGEIRIQQSSAMGDPGVWIFRKTPEFCSEAHLTVEQAKRVRDALDAFITEES